ncbi:uncharacterized protein CMU_017280 [Cryptosporidium muris RN66]|uniref:Uncharacterized protein n=1 Tax=Cryptosporidium muris (strain RN66) TaxID=441375 RepID=B6ACX2_CRYMR|nr:uncharacterized protein CMU_017280 [Cryptosporidium muris RN66]EEA05976.1 hypothetical protein, conserved [Cryptosporidium muris RN66]|eukprot:XP_002140325.1 hypothetical protein [Cryptosporidium muris RN66]
MDSFLGKYLGWCTFGVNLNLENCELCTEGSKHELGEKALNKLVKSKAFVDYSDCIDEAVIKMEARRLSHNSTIMQYMAEVPESIKHEKIERFKEEATSFASEMINGINVEIILGDSKAHPVQLSLNREFNSLALRRRGKKLTLPLATIRCIEKTSQKLIDDAPELASVEKAEFERIVAVSTITDDWYIFVMKNSEMRDKFYHQMRIIVASVKISLAGDEKYWGNIYKDQHNEAVKIEDDSEAAYLFQDEREEHRH